MKRKEKNNIRWNERKILFVEIVRINLHRHFQIVKIKTLLYIFSEMNCKKKCSFNSMY